MMDQRPGQGGARASPTAATSAGRELQLGVAWALATCVAIATGTYLFRIEGGGATGLFTIAVTLTIGAVIVLVSRRVLFALVLVAALLAILHAASYVKQQSTGAVLHAYDVVSVLGSWPAIADLWRDHRYYGAGLLAAAMAAVVIGWAAYRIDATRAPRGLAAGAAAILVSLAVVAAMARDERRHTELHFEDLYISFFFSSWSETIETLWRGRLIEAADRAPGPLFTVPVACELSSRPPHIILIHQESVVQPSHFPSLRYDGRLDALFRSFDGRLNRLRVETFGGASWLTEFSVFTGLSTFSFGGMRQLVHVTMVGKVRDTLPQALTRCGYRNVVFYPMLRTFLGSDKFFAGVGLGEIFDAENQQVHQARERDRFYYSSALAEMERHFGASRRPLFTYIETMAAHGGYDFAYMPDLDVPGGGPGTHPEVHEYLRRLAMVHMDYGFLRAELSRRFPDQQFLIVHYGDHQPTATQTLLGFSEDAGIEEVMRSGNPAALITYYAVDGVNYRPPPLPSLEALDVPYLGTLILEAARLPLSDAHRERKRLMALCHGRYHGCAEQNEILKFHRRLIDSGLLDAR